MSTYTYRERPGRGPQLVIGKRAVPDLQPVTLTARSLAFLLRDTATAARLQALLAAGEAVDASAQREVTK